MSVYPDHFASPLGTARCDSCKRTWPCHLSAWGNPRQVSSCKVPGCQGTVTWAMNEDES